MSAFEKMYSRKEVAGMLGLSVDAVKRLRDRGHLIPVTIPRMGGKGSNETDRFEESELQSFITRNKKGR